MTKLRIFYKKMYGQYSPFVFKLMFSRDIVLFIQFLMLIIQIIFPFLFLSLFSNLCAIYVICCSIYFCAFCSGYHWSSYHKSE